MTNPFDEPADFNSADAATNDAALELAALAADLEKIKGENERLANDARRGAEEAVRAQAELENFRKRLRRDMDEQLRYAPLPLFKDLLPVLDNLERALLAAEKTQESGSLVDGVKLVAAQWLGVLEQHGCKRIAAQGAAFDPHLHEAIAQVPHESVPAGNVAQVVQGGYQFGDRVVRPALVMVSTGPQ